MGQQTNEAKEVYSGKIMECFIAGLLSNTPLLDAENYLEAPSYDRKWSPGSKQQRISLICYNDFRLFRTADLFTIPYFLLFQFFFIIFSDM